VSAVTDRAGGWLQRSGAAAGGTVCAVARRRIDTLLAERGLARSRASAAGEVRAGRVRVGRGGELAAKPGQLVAEDAELAVDAAPPYVSRGGLKLERALGELGVSVAGRLCLDVGASTGGFTDCLLQRDAARVIALDVGRGQLDWRIRNDRRVVVMERTNVRGLTPDRLPYSPGLATIDVSFISLAKVLPAVASTLAADGDVLGLVKPQFELDRRRVGKGGVVREAAARREAIVAVAEAARGLGLRVRGIAPSGLPGPKGNRESFLWLARSGPDLGDVATEARRIDPDGGR
jgi:23S rRNA (cytidine1920-2'-O)/16S rRNA (cytidine1409-2'-O)-methyltransferase